MNETTQLQTTIKDPAFMARVASLVPETMKKVLTPDRVGRMLMAAYNGSQELQKCTTASIMQACYDLCSLGLVIGGPLGEGYIVPLDLKNGKAVAMVNARGFITLAKRSGEVANVRCHLVKPTDTFRLDLASGKPPVHSPDLDADDESIRGAYCTAELSTGECITEYMSMAQIMAIAARSRSFRGGFGPWKTDIGEMARKTVIKRAQKYWPLSTESRVQLAEANRLDLADDVTATVELDPVEEPEPPKPTVIESVKAKLKAAKPANVPPTEVLVPTPPVQPVIPCAWYGKALAYGQQRGLDAAAVTEIIDSTGASPYAELGSTERSVLMDRIEDAARKHAEIEQAKAPADGAGFPTRGEDLLEMVGSSNDWLAKLKPLVLGSLQAGNKRAVSMWKHMDEDESFSEQATPSLASLQAVCDAVNAAIKEG